MNALAPAERKYVRALRGVMAAIHREYMKRLSPQLKALARQDSADSLPNSLAVLGVQIDVAIPGTVGPLFNRMATEVRKANAKGQSLFGIKPRDIGIEAKIQAAREENVKLIKSAHSVYASQVRDILTDPETFGMRVEEISKLLEERGGVSESRAELIARDQTLKLNSAITKERQTSAGVGSYVWSTSLDDRVRPEHAALEGQTFSWDSPPAPGHPGEDIQCRCVAIPVVEELDDVFG